jgi:hypothetical protein
LPASELRLRNTIHMMPDPRNRMGRLPGTRQG